jgi:tellurite resistance protein TerC
VECEIQLTQIMVEINRDPAASSLLNRILSSGWIPNLKFLKRIVIAIVGFTVLLLGVVMIILPGPAFIIIPLGLAILATEFVWAERLLTKAKAYFEKQRQRVSDKMRGKK